MTERRRRVRLDRAGVNVRHSRLTEIQLTSTSDVAFLLLIYFLATAVFVSQLGLPLVLPPAGERPTTVSDSEVVRLVLDSEGNLTAGGEPLALAELAGWARERETEEAGRIYLLDVDAGCFYVHLVTALDALRSASVERISFRQGRSA
jgi:biopolymer transport protein ExbD